MQDAEITKLRLWRAFSAKKREDGPNEDAWGVSVDGMKFAISDGASVSYDPGPWAKGLVSHFIGNPVATQEWLAAAAEAYSVLYDRDALPWMHQAAFDRGSFATLLGVVLSGETETFRVFVVGDSILAIIANGEVVRTLLYQRPEEFDCSPLLLSTSAVENKQFDDEALSNAWHDISLAGLSKPVLLLLTDALGRWLLEDPKPDRVAQLLSLVDDEAFAAFVTREREEGRLRRDDTTMVVIGQAP